MQINLLDKYKEQVSFSQEKPPVFDQCQELFGISWNNTIFAYSPNIHANNPDGLDEDTIQHEMVHIKRQGNEPRIWWEKYLTDNAFRLEEEIVAYRRQYFYLKGNKKIDRNLLDRKVRFWATMLSSQSYGFLTTYQEAYNLITK